MPKPVVTGAFPSQTPAVAPRLVVRGLVPLLAAAVFAGCSGGVSGTAGDEGTVDLSKSVEAAKSNPNSSASKRGLGPSGTPEKAKR